MFGLKVFPKRSLKFVYGNQRPSMDLTAISLWYVIKEVTESLQPAKIKISTRFSGTTDLFRVLSSVRCIFYNHTRHTDHKVRILQPGCSEQD